MERKCFTGSMTGEVEGWELGHVFDGEKVFYREHDRRSGRSGIGSCL